jgi:hypothetical protein
VRVEDRTGEVTWDGDLHRSESRRLAALAGQDVHRLAGIGECRSLAPVCQQGHGPFYHPCPARPLMPPTGLACVSSSD